jgi:hypothetical protein
VLNGDRSEQVPGCVPDEAVVLRSLGQVICEVCTNRVFYLCRSQLAIPNGG